MTEETKTEGLDTEVNRAESKVMPRVAPHAVATIARPTDKWSIRRAEIKRQKRRAHRRRINASNRPG